MRTPAMASCLTLAALAALARPGGAQELSELGSVSQRVSGTRITVEYSRPVERGRRAVFGDLVKWGRLWTPGANWATTLDVDHDVRVEGRLLPKGKYSVWAIPAPDAWTISLHRRARRFHVDRPDSTDEQLRVTVRPDSGPHTEVMTWDFPEVATSTTTLRFRWASVVVPIHIGILPPPLPALGTRAEHAAYLGAYDVEILVLGPPHPHRRIEIVEVGDTLHWRDVDSLVGDRRDFVITPVGEDQFTRWRRDADGAFWCEANTFVSFAIANGRATGFEVESGDGGVVSRATRIP
ncbi:MAG: DUF2911 domain-containing protein [Gemmatimonadaceae bacterium]|nr:DUF2911 domain-containing protein [Gemmatimonadaceae bacterium]NUQ91864.1 DUF2911 domain-containing protein [Gemmatimonadaceae bacterium]NUR20499.1 DUF2911 domain-containing protein [Gemmatimonadaceae bacterium]NUS98079.1 DUF2911 domain-containing protein [Gemmatimonadaceae bacterium]